MKCNRIGCLQVSEYKGFCAHHAKVMNMKSKSDMPKSESKKNKGGGKGGGGYHYLYGTKRWLTMRNDQLHKYPLCIRCHIHKNITPATEVDHVYPHKGDHDKFYDGALQSLCKSCHSYKTSQEKKGYIDDYTIHFK